MTERIGFSIRGLVRAYGVGRDQWAAAIRAGQLPAARLGRRRLLVLRSDAEAWLAKHRVVPAERRVFQREAREAGGR